MCMQQMKLQL